MKNSIKINKSGEITIKLKTPGFNFKNAIDSKIVHRKKCRKTNKKTTTAKKPTVKRTVNTSTSKKTKSKKKTIKKN